MSGEKPLIENNETTRFKTPPALAALNLRRHTLSERRRRRTPELPVSLPHERGHLSLGNCDVPGGACHAAEAPAALSSYPSTHFNPSTAQGAERHRSKQVEMARQQERLRMQARVSTPPFSFGVVERRTSECMVTGSGVTRSKIMACHSRGYVVISSMYGAPSNCCCCWVAW